MRIRLTDKFDWKVPGVRAVVAFTPGDWVMTRAQGEDAIAKGLGAELVQGDGKVKRAAVPKQTD